jgi:hypothetical protein
MQLKHRDVEAIFAKLEMEVRSTHHVIGWFTYKGKKVLKARFSLGKGDIPEKIAHKLRGQLKLNLDDFIVLRDCPLDRDGYIAILKDKGLISEPAPE